MKSNVMKMPTFKYLKLNSVDIEEKNFEKKEYKNFNSSDIIKPIYKFNEKEYGISKLSIDENEKYNNLKIYEEISGEKSVKYIDLSLDEKNNELFSSIDIDAKENSKSSFLINVHSKNNLKNYVNNLVRVNLEKNSYVKIVLITNINENSESLQQFVSVIEDNANLDLSYIELGSNKSYVNFKNYLDGDKSKLDFNGIYFKENDDYLDMLITNEHNGNFSNSKTIFNGALKDNSKKAWKGIVDLQRGCKEADGKISDFSVLLSDDVVSKTTPILLCREEKVKGSHAASVGRMNPDMLFYIMSRGLNKKQAESMILEASFMPVLEKIEENDLKEKLKNKVHKMNSGS
ncbi:MAG: SufD family Fe-S cluster assembly protein [Peptoniphilaceae bacterium]|nr:SufD family Fe-S cluster assembly protein [Peptoniphilaceae bacterium]